MKHKLALGLLLSLFITVPLAATPPNLVIFLADDLSFNDLHCWGSPDAKTPHLDKLASEGMKLTRLYSAAPTCTPTRSALYTGLYPVRNGAHPNHSSVKPGTQSIPHLLKPLGYRVGIVGKTMVRPIDSFPFDYLDTTKTIKHRKSNSASKESNNEEEEDGDGNLDFAAIQKYMMKDKSQPYCLIVASHQPHGPWDKGDASAYKADKLTMPTYLVDTPETREERTHYLAEVTFLDAEVGRIVELLKESGQEENTLFLFLSEQGAGLPYAKYNLYDPGIRSAAIARWPGKIKANSESDALSSYVDVVPTFIELAGGKPVPGLDGHSFVNVLMGKSNKHSDYVFAEATSLGVNGVKVPYAIRAVCDDRYKYILNLNHENEFPCNRDAHQAASAWRKLARTDVAAGERLERFLHRPEVELYDLSNDPWEQINIAKDSANGEVLNRLRQRLDGWMNEQGDKGTETELAVKERVKKVPKSSKAKK